jgi:hypothetical protein
MAKFGESFLQQLGRPGWSQGMFGLGSAIGGAQGQIRDQRKKQEFNQLMQQIQGAQGSGDFNSMKILSQQLAAIDPQQAAKVMQAAVAGEKQQQQVQEKTQETRAGAQMLMSELQDYASNPSLPDSARTEASNLLKAAAQAGDRAGLLEPRVQQLRTRLNQTAKPVSLSAGGALVSPTGEVLYERPFKPTAAAKPKIDIIRPTKDDPNIRIFEDGKLTQTISTKPEGKTLEQVEMDNDRISQIVRIKGDISELMKEEGRYADWTASGVLGQLLGNFWGGSTAYDRKSLMDSVKASLGLEAIQALKEASKQGATGLGQVSNLELRALQSEIATLEIGQSEQAQLDSLTKIFNHLDRIQQIASGIVPTEAIDWNSPEYKAAGYGRDVETGVIMYAPQGRNGPAYKLVDGSFKKLDI